MKTKNVVLLLVVCCYALTGYAQEQLSYGVKAGMNFTRYVGKKLREDRQIRTGFHIGVNVEAPVYSKIYIQPGLLFSTKGIKFPAPDTYGTDLEVYPTFVNFYCLEMHLPLIYKYALGNGNIILGAGPFLSYALQMNSKYGSQRNELNFGKHPHQTRRTDVGPMILAGYELKKKITLQVAFSRGLVNFNNSTIPEKTKFYHYGYTISAGYRF